MKPFADGSREPNEDKETLKRRRAREILIEDTKSVAGICAKATAAILVAAVAYAACVFAGAWAISWIVYWTDSTPAHPMCAAAAAGFALLVSLCAIASGIVRWLASAHTRAANEVEGY